MRRKEWERQKRKKKKNSNNSSCFVCVWVPPSGRPSEPPALTCQPESEHSCVGGGDTKKGETISVCKINMKTVKERLEKVLKTSQKQSISSREKLRKWIYLLDRHHIPTPLWKEDGQKYALSLTKCIHTAHIHFRQVKTKLVICCRAVNYEVFLGCIIKWN